MPLPITIPNTFATATSNIALSLLDANFTTVANAINGIGNGSNTLTAPVISGGNVALTALGYAGGNGTVLSSNGSAWLTAYPKVIQTAYQANSAYGTLSTLIPFDDTIPQNTEGTQVFSISFTPVSNTSTIRITVQANTMGSGATNICLALFSGSGVNAIACGYGTGSAGPATGVGSLIYNESSANTSARTYSVRCGGDGTVYFNGNSGGRKYGGTLVSTMVIEEITS